MDAFEIRMKVYEQASSKRKTIDKSLLRMMVLSRINAANYQHRHADAADRVFLSATTGTLEGLLHALDCYGGYNARAWEAFTMLDGWVYLVEKLHGIDDDRGTQHYWNLLSILERRWQGQPPRHFYGGCGEEPTNGELRRAGRILKKYQNFLGL